MLSRGEGETFASTSTTQKGDAMKIEIYRDGVWAGTGRLDSDGEIVDCSAVLGPNQDASDETYEAIQDSIDSEPQDEGRYLGQGSIERPDGVYSWILREPTEKSSR